MIQIDFKNCDQSEMNEISGKFELDLLFDFKYYKKKIEREYFS